MPFPSNLIIQIRNIRTSLYFILGIANVQSPSIVNSLPLSSCKPFLAFFTSLFLLVSGTLHISLSLNWDIIHILSNSPLKSIQFYGFLVYSQSCTSITTNSSTCPHVPSATIPGLYCALLSLSAQTACLAGGILSYSAKIFPLSSKILYAHASVVALLCCTQVTGFCHPTTCMPLCLLSKQKNFKPLVKVSRKWDK